MFLRTWARGGVRGHQRRQAGGNLLGPCELQMALIRCCRAIRFYEENPDYFFMGCALLELSRAERCARIPLCRGFPAAVISVVPDVKTKAKVGRVHHRDALQKYPQDAE